MQVGRRLASSLTILVVLWTAIPIFACLAGADQHCCCRGAAQECNSPATMTGADCCVVQPPSGPVLPGHAAIASQVVNLAATAVVPQMPVLPQLSVSQQATSADSPPGSSSTTPSVLRI